MWSPSREARKALTGFANDPDAPIRVLMLSTLIAPDIVEYLDSGKLGARSVAGERIMFGKPGPELDYWEDED